jgi:hypothetical protein
MMRAACLTAVVLCSLAATLPAQSRNRDRDFGQSQETWCRDARDADFCEVREETLNNLSTVDVDARGNGGVSVRGWDRNDVQVRMRLTAYARTDTEARDLAKAVRLTTSGGVIRADGPRRDNDGRSWNDRAGRYRRDAEWWAVSYELQVPRNAKLTIDATNGGIVVDDVRGSIDAETTNGGLMLYDVSGDVRGRAVNGGVTVDLAGDRWQGTGLDVRTTNGGVRVFLPSNFSGELVARTVNGGINVDFPITVQGLINSRRQIHATIGSGGPPIRVATTNGGVRISRR